MILIYTPRSHAGPRLSYITPAPASSHRRRAVLRLAHRRRDARRSQQRANPPLQAGACRNSRRARRWRLCCGTCAECRPEPRGQGTWRRCPKSPCACCTPSGKTDTGLRHGRRAQARRSTVPAASVPACPDQPGARTISLACRIPPRPPLPRARQRPCGTGAPGCARRS